MLSRCTNCILTNNEDPNIFFNDKGVCNYCIEYKSDENKRRVNRLEWPWIVFKMKQKDKYDCLLGLSGGVDSSYCLHLLIEQGLKPFCFSVDNGWQTPEAQENIMRMVEGLKVPYYRYNINITKFRELQDAFIESGVKNIEIPTDHILMATTYEMANQYGIKHIISGGNLATEGIMPAHFGYNAKDLTHLKGVYKKMTGKTLTGLPTISLMKYLYYRFIKGIKIINMLDYYEYNREKAIKILEKNYGYKPYGEKHYESEFTKWFQGTYLFKKFGLDKRIPHYSSLINSGQMKREEALKLIQKPPESSNLIEFGYLRQEHNDYPTSEKWWNLLSNLYKKWKS